MEARRDLHERVGLHLVGRQRAERRGLLHETAHGRGSEVLDVSARCTRNPSTCVSAVLGSVAPRGSSRSTSAAMGGPELEGLQLAHAARSGSLTG